MTSKVTLEPLLRAAGLPHENFGHHMKGVDDIVQKGPLTELCA